MAKQSQTISFDQGDPIVYKKKQEFILPINIKDWNRIKKMAARIKSPKRVWGTLGSIALGVFTSSLVAVITEFPDRNSHNEFCGLVTTCLSALSVLIFCYLLAYFRKSDINTRGTEVVEEMQYIENNYESPIDNTTGYNVG